jgi:lysyl-tRNA synthetase class 1
MKKDLVHWADHTAQKIINLKGDKDHYVLACGITPSGTVHFGNFRETITVDLVARALRDRGKEVRFIFSWDDYDTFRKIPKNVPNPEKLEEYLFQPIMDTPDPYSTAQSYALHHEKKFEQEIDEVGIEVEFISQTGKYRNGDYRDGIGKALKDRDKIVEILDQYRTEPHKNSWLPVSIYCESCNRDKLEEITFDGEDTLTYKCQMCSHQGSEHLSTSKRLKLPWRVDWPMRWSYENVDFEPGGKDHSSQGGSYTTAKEIAQKIYGFVPPVYLQYDFVSIKGGAGKMSSSSGEVVTVGEVLKIYEPEMIRWIFASYKPNVDFAVSFDLDVLKLYEDFDRMERLAFGVDQGNEKKRAMAARVYELSQIGPMPQQMPFQPSFRHLCNILQIFEGDLSKAREHYAQEIKNDRDERRFTQRAQCALNWLELYAPDDFKFKLNSEKIQVEMTQAQSQFVTSLKNTLQNEWDNFSTDKDLHEKIYELMKMSDLKPQDTFCILYKLLISRDQGPKLAGFIRTIGQEKALALL